MSCPFQSARKRELFHCSLRELYRRSDEQCWRTSRSVRSDKRGENEREVRVTQQQGNYVIFRQQRRLCCVQKMANIAYKDSRLFTRQKQKLICNSLGSALNFTINEQHFPPLNCHRFLTQASSLFFGNLWEKSQKSSRLKQLKDNSIRINIWLVCLWHASVAICFPLRKCFGNDSRTNILRELNVSIRWWTGKCFLIVIVADEMDSLIICGGGREEGDKRH